MDELEPLLIAGSSHPKLAAAVARASGISLGKAQIERFSDGEISIEILDNVRDREVFVLQSVAHRPNEWLMELLILVDALKRASAGRITAIIPYFGYARQDRRGDVRAPITAKLIADLLQASGVDHLVSVDLHAEQIQGFFDIAVDNLHAAPVLLEGIKALKLQGVGVAPDIGSIKIARHLASQLGMGFAVVDKERSHKRIEVRAVIGDVSKKDVLIIDDMCTTGSTLLEAVKVLKESGAGKVYGAISHGLFVNDALSAIEHSPIEKVFVTDTVYGIPEHPKIQILSVASFLGEALSRLLEAKSLSTLLK